LFVAFQSTSSNVSILAGSQQILICFNGDPMFWADYNGRGAVGFRHGTQSDCNRGKPTAVVNTEHPELGKLGFGFILLSFIAQWLSIDTRELRFSKSQIRALTRAGALPPE
jgi:hypothetical protein